MITFTLDDEGEDQKAKKWKRHGEYEAWDEILLQCLGNYEWKLFQKFKKNRNKLKTLNTNFR